MKSYVSPIVSFESFELSSTYASGCEYKQAIISMCACMTWSVAATSLSI